MAVAGTPKRRRQRPYGESAIIEQHRWKLSLLRDFIARHGWAKLGREVMVPPGVRLFNWVATRREDYRKDRIADWLAAACEEVPGWSWAPLRDAHRRHLDLLRSYVKGHGWSAVKGETVVEGVRLHRWMAHRRAEYNRGTLAPWLIAGLQAITGWTWDPRTSGHAHHLKQLRGHVARHGWESIDPSTTSRDGTRIGHWLPTMRALHRKGKLPAWLAAGLEAIPGWTAKPRRSRQRLNAAALAHFVAKHGWDAVTEALVVRGVALAVWVSSCRARHREGILPSETAADLEAIDGWSWTAPVRRPGQDRRGRFTKRRKA